VKALTFLRLSLAQSCVAEVLSSVGSHSAADDGGNGDAHALGQGGHSGELDGGKGDRQPWRQAVPEGVAASRPLRTRERRLVEWKVTVRLPSGQ
jgi:hypothetical protein